MHTTSVCPPVLFLQLQQHVEGGGPRPLQLGLHPPVGLLSRHIPQRHRLHPANEGDEVGVLHQVGQGGAVGRGHHQHTTLRDGLGGRHLLRVDTVVGRFR